MSDPAQTRPNYLAIFGGLVLLTLVEILVAMPGVAATVGRLGQVLLLIALAVAKAALVALYFMHLRYERLLLSVVFLVPLGMSIILVVLTVLDRPFVP